MSRMMTTLPEWLIISLFINICLSATVIILRYDAARTRTGRRPAMLVAGRVLALLYAALALFDTALSTVGTLTSDAVAVALPVAEFWPEPYPWVTLDDAPTATVVSGGINTADVTVSGLGLGARLWLASGHAVQGLTLTFIALVVALLCHRVLAGSPFRPVLARATKAAAVAVTIGGLTWQILFMIGGSMASAQLLDVDAWSSQLPAQVIADYIFARFDQTGLPQSTLAIAVDFWPILIGTTLAALALAFETGERMQSDTDGLI